LLTPLNRNHGFHTCSLQGFAHRSSSTFFSRSPDARASFLEENTFGGWEAIAASLRTDLTPFINLDPELDNSSPCLVTTAPWTLGACFDRVYVRATSIKVRWDMAVIWWYSIAICGALRAKKGHFNDGIFQHHEYENHSISLGE
jgi:hypothetical protein